ncbi:unnamed protein product [Lathyrus sativus]|nr:unnamed protein product [Lathyrus sativus]
MLVNQELHENRRTHFCFPVGSERIPEWFEHQSIISMRIFFWFRNKIPSIVLFFSTNFVHRWRPQIYLFSQGIYRGFLFVYV